MRQTGDEDRLQTGKVASDGTVVYTGCLAERIQVGHGELIVQPVEYFTEIIRAGKLGDICRGGKLRHQQAAVFEADIDYGKGRPEMNIVTETLVHPVIERSDIESGKDHAETESHQSVTLHGTQEVFFPQTGRFHAIAAQSDGSVHPTAGE